MAKFLTPLDARKVEGTTDKWKLLSNLVYQSDLIGTFTVPIGFVTDFASTPRIVWIICPKDGLWDDIAVVHDYLYYLHAIDRAICDKVFLEGLTVLNVPLWQRYPMYLAVRSFGWMFYGK